VSTLLTRSLRRGWWIALACAVVALGAAALVTARQRPVYRAAAQLAVAPNSRVTDTADVLRSLETLERRTVVATFARIASARETRDGAARRLGLEPKELRAYWVGGSVVPNTNIIRVEVLGPEPERTAAVADAAAREVAREGRRLYPIYSLRALARAEPPRRPERPDLRRNLTVGAILGLFVGAAAALALGGRGGRVSPG
jgi:uncharacterized protein involved in exopolysaccharide biosynthesis